MIGCPFGRIQAPSVSFELSMDNTMSSFLSQYFNTGAVDIAFLSSLKLFFCASSKYQATSFSRGCRSGCFIPHKFGMNIP